ncbi:hypothetical protein E8E12_003570 [Didymella heteroderae]|uniref:Uncharacterized protein n=1 Tax=Didymella heteroderae TaxID=1769908 RepID=A0A9P4WJQ4_9PLEO|nr:hypothetical protein E8E12_003570 [Didymella heteroderae]
MLGYSLVPEPNITAFKWWAKNVHQLNGHVKFGERVIGIEMVYRGVMSPHGTGSEPHVEALAFGWLEDYGCRQVNDQMDYIRSVGKCSSGYSVFKLRSSATEERVFEELKDHARLAYLSSERQPGDEPGAKPGTKKNQESLTFHWRIEQYN